MLPLKTSAIALCGLLAAHLVLGQAQPLEWTYTEVANPFPSDETWFGFAVAVDGDTVVVGARKDPDIQWGGWGAAYVYEKDSSGDWAQTAKLIPSEYLDAYTSTQIADLDIHDTTIVLRGGLGLAWIFERDHGGPGAWGEVATLVPSDLMTTSARGTVAIHGDTVVLGCDIDWLCNQGAHVFERNHGGANAWGQAQQLVSGGPDWDEFGYSAAIHGDTIVVGTPGDIPGSPESAIVFRRDAASGFWSEVKKLTPSGGETLGESVAIDGDVVAVGSYLFERNAGGTDQWNEVANLRGRGEVGIDGDLLVQLHSTIDKVHRQVSEGSWSHVGSIPNGVYNEAKTVSIQGLTIVRGDPFAQRVEIYELTPSSSDDALGLDLGASGLWKLDESNWTRLASWDAVTMTTWNDALVVNFGPGRGLWIYEKAIWTQLTSWAPTMVAALETKLAAAFDAGRGIWLYDGSQWTQATNWEPTLMAGSGDRLGAAFGSDRGLWIYESATWTWISDWEPYLLAGWEQPGGTDHILAAFDGGRGVRTIAHNWPTLHQFTDLEPEQLVVTGSRWYADFGPGLGLYSFGVRQHGFGWSTLTPWDPYLVTGSWEFCVAGFDGDRGMWRYDHRTFEWLELTPWEARQVVRLDGQFAFAFDFGPGRGIYLYHDTDGWQQLTGISAEALGPVPEAPAAPQ